MKPFDVFISASSKDFENAGQVYDFLVGQNLHVFFSKKTLQQLGSSYYRQEIDKAIEHTNHMVVVTSSRENVEGEWVEAEWGSFINEKRSGRKTGNLVTLLVGKLTPDQLPMSLRQYEIIPDNDSGLDKLLSYVTVGIQNLTPHIKPKLLNISKKPFKTATMFAIGAGVLTLALFVGYLLIPRVDLGKKLLESKELAVVSQDKPATLASPSQQTVAALNSSRSDYQEKDALEKKKRDAEANRAIQEALNEKKLAEEQAAKASQEKKVIEEKLAAAEAKQKADTEKAAKRIALDRAQNLDKSQEQRTNDMQSQQISSQQSVQPPPQLKVAPTSKQGAAIYINSPGNNDLYIEKLANQVRKELRVNGREAMSLSAARYSVRWANARIGKEGPDGMGEFTFSIKLNGEIIDTNTGQVIKSIPEEETEKGRDQNATYILDSLIKTVSKRLAQQLTLP